MHAQLTSQIFTQVHQSIAIVEGEASCSILSQGQKQQLTLSSDFNLVLIINGQLSTQGMCYDAGSLVMMKGGFSVWQGESHCDAVMITLSLSSNWITNFKQRYQDFVKPLQTKSLKPLTRINFSGCDLTRMAFNGLTQLLADQSQSPLTRLKIEELLLLQLGKKHSSDLLVQLFAACDPATSRLRQFMQQHYLKDWSLQNYAAELGMSLTAFKTTFQQVFQCSPRAWINEQRLSYAAFLLQSSQMRVIDIAFEAGFSSQSYFTQAYKAKFGTTPKQVRA